MHCPFPRLTLILISSCLWQTPSAQARQPDTPAKNVSSVMTDTLQTSGPPLVDISGVLFRFEPPKELDVVNVNLAGSFNGWASNDDGVIRGSRFAMQQADSGVWYKWIDLPDEEFEYQYVVETRDGKMIWMADPFVNERSGSNSIGRLTESPSLSGSGESYSSPSASSLRVAPERIWVEPGQPNRLLVHIDDTPSGLSLNTRLLTPLGRVFYTHRQAVGGQDNVVEIPPINAVGGFVAEVALQRQDGDTIETVRTILSVSEHPEDDLRYGFFATYPKEAHDYDVKASMLVDLYINAVEFYDYFPAHGDYAPDEETYTFEPFGIAINGLDVEAKLAACQHRGILALAYIAAYAASESVYRKIPDPMTDVDGKPKVFNGTIMTEDKADAQGKPKWFWLMNISENSRWRTYIIPELQRSLTGGDSGVANFDGFEIDTYGDNADERFYAPDSPQSGQALADVLQGFVSDVSAMTHQTKQHGLVSFNSVNEFGVEKMYDTTDFLFLEIWRWHAPLFSDLTDICYHHRNARNQRVVLKLYPADMDDPRTTWPTLTLTRILGATMTGGGSLMVVGEPDEESGTMHALNSLFYPDHQPLSPANADVLQRYYQHDAMLYGYTHGREVENMDAYIPVQGCVTRAFHAPERNAYCVQLLNIGQQRNWTKTPAPVPVKQDLTVNFPLPDGITPQAVFYASPDRPEYQMPVEVPFVRNDGQIAINVPELVNHGTLIVQY